MENFQEGTESFFNSLFITTLNILTELYTFADLFVSVHAFELIVEGFCEIVCYEAIMIC